MTKASKIVNLGRSQIGVKESPPGSNRTKYGKDFGWNGVAWCAIYSWWKGWRASKKKESQNPIYKSASAANIQDLTVKCKKGTYIMKKTSSKERRQAMARRVLPGDEVSFDFGDFSCVRKHTGTADSIDGDYIYCNEGNTSVSGSQSNGGQVCNRKRHYTDICCVVRPAYKMPAPWKLDKALPVDGDFGIQSRYRMQWWLGVKRDADCGPATVKAMQKKLGVTQTGLWTHDVTRKLQEFLKKTDKTLAIDGDFGTMTIRAFQSYLNSQLPEKQDAADGEQETETEKPAEKKKTKREKAVELCYKCAWPKKRKYRKYYKYPRGRAKKAYAKLLQKVYGARKGWRDQTRKGASCDVAAVAIIRAMFDKKFPRGCDDMPAYFRTDHCKKKWKFLKEKNWRKWKPFTVVYQKYDSGAQHIFIYLGGGYVYNAHYCKKTYPIIEKASKVVKPASGCRTFRVLVPR